MFFGSGSDAPKSVTYRPLNLACAKMDLSGTELNPKSFRAILHCFNAYGGLDPAERLMNRLSDQELKPLVDTANQYVLESPPTLYGLDRAFHDLDAKGQARPAYQAMGKVLENDDFIATSVSLFRDAYFSDQKAAILRSFERLAAKITPQAAATGLDAAMLVGSAPSFYTLQLGLRGESEAGQGLRTLTDAMLGYLQAQESSEHPPIGRAVLEAAANGDLFRAFDEALGGTDADALKVGVPRISSVFGAVGANHGEILDGMTSLFHELHVPVPCLDGTKILPDGDMHFVEEIVRQKSDEAASFARRASPLTFVTLKPFCDQPAGLKLYYPAIERLADTNAMAPATDLIKGLYHIEYPGGGPGSHPLADVLIELLADRETKRLLPIISELASRGTFDDLLLLASIPRIEDREALGDALSFVLEPVSAQDPRAIYDIWFDAFASVSADDLYAFARSLGRFVKSDVPVAQPAIDALRTGFYIDDRHPIVEIAHSFLADASRQEALFDTFFKMTGYSEFRETIALVATMAQDGRLRDLTEALLALYRPYTAKGNPGASFAPDPKPVPPLDLSARSRHRLSSNALTPYPLTIAPLPAADPCRNLDIDFLLTQTSSASYDAKLDDYVNCLSQVGQAQGGREDIRQSLQYLRDHRTSGGEDFFRFTVGLGTGVGFAKQELQYLGDSFFAAMESGEFTALLGTVPYLARHAFASAGDAAGPLLRPLLDLLGPLMQAEPRRALHELERFGAAVLRREDFTAILAYLDEVSARKPEPVPAPVVMSLDEAKIEGWVGARECVSADARRARAEEVIADFNNGVNSWERVGEPGEGSSSASRARSSWDLPTLKTQLDPVFAQLALENVPNGKPVLDALLSVMDFFRREPGTPPSPTQPFTSSDLYSWFKDRASDYRVITYFHRHWDPQRKAYRYDQAPQVKIVNTLDMLELVLIDADFSAPMVGNSALKYTRELGRAWGDEPREAWPADIRAEADRTGHAPKRLIQVEDEMVSFQHSFAGLLGFPKTPDCGTPPALVTLEVGGLGRPERSGGRTAIADPELAAFAATLAVQAKSGGVNDLLYDLQRSLYNLQQVLAVMDENRPLGTPAEELKRPHPRPDHAGGLRLLRDLFYELDQSTPPEFRGYKLSAAQEWKNHLKIATQLARLGVFRETGLALRAGREEDLAQQGLFHALVTGSDPQGLKPIAHALFVEDPEQKLVWKVMEKVFAVLDDPAHPLDSLRLKQLAVYSLAESDRLGLVDPLLGAGGQILSGDRQLLLDHAESVESLLRSESASLLARALFEDQNQAAQLQLADVLRGAVAPAQVSNAMTILEGITVDSQAQASWDLFMRRKDVAWADPAFQANRDAISRFATQALEFLEEKSHEPGAGPAARRMRLFLADRLERGDLDEYLNLGASPAARDEFYQLFTTFSTYVENGDLDDFFKMVQRSLSGGG